MSLVQPELLEWAIERSHQSVHDLHGAFPHLESWLSGSTEPPIAQLEKFATATKTPVGYLFLQEPPVEEFPLTDFRRRQVSSVDVSADLRDQVYICQQKQDWYIDYALEEGLEPVSVVGMLTVETEPYRAAQVMRDQLAIDPGHFESISVQQAAVSNFAEQVENLGILVMISGVVGFNTKRVLNPQEFSGFSFSHALAPLIFVNGTETKSAQMFTLAHELAHIFLGDTSISTASPESLVGSRHEVWCNEVAAEFLMPADRVTQLTRAADVRYEFLTAIAARFKVSPLALLIRWRELDLVNEVGFQTLRQEYELELSKIPKKTAPSGGSFFTTAPVRSGKRLTRAVLGSTFEGETSFTDAFKMLGSKKTDSLRELALRMGVL